MQQHQLLQTKLHIPPIRPELVSRPRLLERLSAGLDRKLTLVSAPAGFGKTTLVTQWLKGARCPSTWLSLDESDNDTTRFLVYLVSALQAIEANIGKGALSALQSPQPPPIKAVLTSLINEITALPDRIVLVLDDYHVIDAKPVDASTSVDGALTFLLEHLPPPPGGLHLVIATREDPNLPLARLRIRGQLTELRITDLRFTPSEAAEFFTQVMGLNLSAEQVTSLETRTEGWIAGLQLAALALQGTLSMQGREDVSGFIRAFAGDNRYIVDYLVEEVLQRQPERVWSFLLQTSILDRLSGPLCDAVRFGGAKSPSTPEGDAVRFGKADSADLSAREATAGADAVRFGKADSADLSAREATAEADAVGFGYTETPTGQEDGRGMLEALERGNLFVVPLDDKRQWYRYHHLFADVLQAHLMEELPHQVPTLHRRASEWYEHNGSPADAIRHALAAEDFERAAGLVELAWPEMDWSFQSTRWLGWVKSLPDELVRARPVLSVDYAWALLNQGELEAADARLRDAERWLEPTTNTGERLEDRPTRMVVVDEEQFRSLPATIASAHAYYAQTLGDAAASVRYARRALDLLPESDHPERGRLAVLLGLVHWASGDLEAAHQSFADAMASFRMAGNILYAISFTFILADIRTAQGRLHEAIGTYERSLQLATEQGEPALEGTGDLHLGLSELHREQGDLEAARQHLLRCEELGEQSEVYKYRLCRAQARIKGAQGDLDGALELLDEAERWLYYRTPLPDLRPTAAMKARVWVAQGRLTEALGWARERDLTVDDDLSYLREFEHVTLVRLLIAQYKVDQVERSIQEAMGLLKRLLKAAEEGGRMGSVIEILVLQALAHQAQGDTPDALDALERALILAEPEGHVRIFVDEGPPMAGLLKQLYRKGAAVDYIAQILAAFEEATMDEGRTKEPSSSVLRPSSLVEPLTERELDVLKLLGTELNGPEIARELVVSLNTMRTHTKNIYSKLGVHNRRAAVRRAEELGLL